MTMSPPGIAFFDLDKTLIRKNSGSMWLRHELASGAISYRQFMRALTWLARYSLGFAGLDGAVLEAIRSLRDTKESELVQKVDAFYANEVRPLYRPGARAAIDDHRTAGHRLVLLTSASCYLSEHVVRELDLDGYLANRFEVRADGTFSGDPDGPLCFGAGKLVLAEGYAQAAGIPLEACAFYTDSMIDLPVLEAVGRPVAVHPDPRLGRYARSRGWEIARWD